MTPTWDPVAYCERKRVIARKRAVGVRNSLRSVTWATKPYWDLKRAQKVAEIEAGLWEGRRKEMEVPQ